MSDQVEKLDSISSEHTASVSKYFQNTDEMEGQDNGVEVTSQSIKKTEKSSQDNENLFSQDMHEEEVVCDKEEQTAEINKETKEANNVQEDFAKTMSELGDVRLSEEVKERHISPERDHGHDDHANESDEDEIPLVFKLRKIFGSEPASTANKAKGTKKTRGSPVKSRLIDEIELVNVETIAVNDDDDDDEVEIKGEDAPLEKKNSKKNKEENKKHSEQRVTPVGGDKSTKESKPSKKRKSRNNEESGSSKK
ncbi:KNR4/SMI1 homolog [Lycium barbarum]|uniref:KNR4/SMI1 homolog n=1 Tax=Lycium barbarum TaxID=112863 RepID=UPI00293EA1D9|nr:KNR4/SMI1 homolog [Lycium barbarum]